jgi:hypothetical protein
MLVLSRCWLLHAVHGAGAPSSPPQHGLAVQMLQKLMLLKMMMMQITLTMMAALLMRMRMMHQLAAAVQQMTKSSALQTGPGKRRGEAATRTAAAKASCLLCS